MKTISDELRDIAIEMDMTPTIPLPNKANRLREIANLLDYTEEQAMAVLIRKGWTFIRIGRSMRAEGPPCT